MTCCCCFLNTSAKCMPFMLLIVHVLLYLIVLFITSLLSHFRMSKTVSKVLTCSLLLFGFGWYKRQGMILSKRYAIPFIFYSINWNLSDVLCYYIYNKLHTRTCKMNGCCMGEKERVWMLHGQRYRQHQGTDAPLNCWYFAATLC